MNEMQVFSYEENEVRTVQKDGELWWVLKDVCDVLGLSNPTIVATRLDGDEVTKFDLGGLSGESNIINESGLYNVIIRSDKPEAKKFKRWVTHEVLPSIRRHGAYMTPAKIDDLLLNPDTIIQLATHLKAEREESERLSFEVTKRDQIIGELKPKADYVDWILQNPGLMNITQIAKDYGMSGVGMNKMLHELGVQYKQRNQWLLYEKYHDKGYTHSESVDITHSDGRQDIKLTTKWTSKGRLFIYNLLKDKLGVTPVIENASPAWTQ